VKYLARGGATERLGWLLDGLSGAPGWGEDAAANMAPKFAAAMPPERLAEVYRRHAADLAPVLVIGLDLGENRAQARMRARDGDIYVIRCAVEPEPPHRLTSAWLTGLVPASLTPRLPMDFAEYPLPAKARGTKLIVFSGVPGSGKSTLADATGAALGIPVFAVDWLLGSLTPFGGYHLGESWGMGTELLTTLALRQLQLGQSAILDYPAEEPANRDRWRSLAARAGSDFRVIMCICPDEAEHKRRLGGRERGIPGWHEGGDWVNVQRRLAAFPPWADEVLTVDTTGPQARALAAILEYCGAGAAPPAETAARSGDQPDP
jgi:predicted kinase